MREMWDQINSKINNRYCENYQILKGDKARKNKNSIVISSYFIDISIDFRATVNYNFFIMDTILFF